MPGVVAVRVAPRREGIGRVGEGCPGFRHRRVNVGEGRVDDGGELAEPERRVDPEDEEHHARGEAAAPLDSAWKSRSGAPAEVKG